MHSHSFEDIELKLHRYVNDSTKEVVKRLMILPYLKRGREQRVNHSKTLIQSAFTQFSRYRVETSQLRQRLQVTGRGEVDESTLPLEGLGIKG